MLIGNLVGKYVPIYLIAETDSEIYLAYDRQSHNYVCLKTGYDLNTELDMYALLKGKCFVQKLNAFKFNGLTCIITPLYGYTCKDINRPLNNDEIKIINNMLVESLNVLKNMELIHTDIKAENIFIDHINPFYEHIKETFNKIKKLRPSKMLNKLTELEFEDDFHHDIIVKNVVLADYDKMITFDELNEHSLYQTPVYTSPEVLLEQKLTYKMDYWSIGYLLWELITNESPYKFKDHLTTNRNIYYNMLCYFGKPDYALNNSEFYTKRGTLKGYDYPRIIKKNIDLGEYTSYVLNLMSYDPNNRRLTKM